MENVRYTVKRLAEIVGATPRQVEGALGKRDLFGPEVLPELREKLNRHPKPLRAPRVQLFLNFKGGTGKTSLSSSYAYRLAERGYRVLAVDLDSQGHATKCLGHDGAAVTRTLVDVLVQKTPIAEATLATRMPNLSLVPANLAMSSIDIPLSAMAGREFKLKKALSEVLGQYDFVVLDAPPSSGLLNINALVAADDLIVPVLADFLSYDGLRLLFETVHSLDTDLDHQLDHIFIAVNAYNQTFRIAREALAALKENYADYLLKGVVRQCTKFAQASSEGCPIFGFDPESKGATDIEAMQDEILARIQGA
jgi:chromosome partitioning protein